MDFKKLMIRGLSLAFLIEGIMNMAPPFYLIFLLLLPQALRALRNSLRPPAEDPRIKLVRDNLSNLRAIFSCPVSMELLKRPALLRCGHVIESSILNRMQASGCAMMCPICRAPIMRMRCTATRRAWNDALEEMRDIEHALAE